jgi:hypothetical protein
MPELITVKGDSKNEKRTRLCALYALRQVREYTRRLRRSLEPIDIATRGMLALEYIGEYKGVKHILLTQYERRSKLPSPIGCTIITQEMRAMRMIQGQVTR